jgi:hypothetical protein
LTLLWFCRWFFKSSPSPVLLIRKSSKGGHLLAPIRSASTLHCLHVLPFRSVLGGMASTTTHARSMSVLPRHRTWGTSPTIMGGSSVQPPPHNYGYYHHGHGGPPVHHGGAPVCPSVSVGAWGASCSSSGFTLVWVRWWDLSPGPWGVSPCGYIGYPEPGVCGLVSSPFFATGGSPFLF